MKRAQWIFRIAGAYGLLVTFPLYFLEQKMGVDYPPPVTHPEYFYSFAGITIVWQILFFVIAADPLRYRKIMLLSIVEKLTLLPTFILLFPQGRFPTLWLPLMAMDLFLGLLFLIAYIGTPKGEPGSSPIAG